MNLFSWNGNSDYNNPKKTESIYTERKNISSIISENKILKIGSKWQPISMEWFIKWKKYVDYDKELNNNNNFHISSTGDIENYNETEVVVYIILYFITIIIITIMMSLCLFLFIKNNIIAIVG